jgi:DNA-binding transcriptional ArsR family regulator
MALTRKSDSPLPGFTFQARGRSLPVVQPSAGGHDCVVALRALGEDTRVRIVSLLMEEALEVGEIARRLGVSQYNVSKHLRILREAGLLESEKDGRRHLYALPEAIRRSAATGNVLDLGCCSFQFDEAKGRASRSTSEKRRKRVVRPHAR